MDSIMDFKSLSEFTNRTANYYQSSAITNLLNLENFHLPMGMVDLLAPQPRECKSEPKPIRLFQYNNMESAESKICRQQMQKLAIEGRVLYDALQVAKQNICEEKELFRIAKDFEIREDSRLANELQIVKEPLIVKESQNQQLESNNVAQLESQTEDLESQIQVDSQIKSESPTEDLESQIKVDSQIKLVESRSTLKLNSEKDISSLADDVDYYKKLKSKSSKRCKALHFLRSCLKRAPKDDSTSNDDVLSHPHKKNTRVQVTFNPSVKIRAFHLGYDEIQFKKSKQEKQH